MSSDESFSDAYLRVFIFQFQDMLEALKALSGFFTENSLRSRRNLRSDIEKRSLGINEEFLSAFQAVKEVNKYIICVCVCICVSSIMLYVYVHVCACMCACMHTCMCVRECVSERQILGALAMNNN